MRPVRLMIALTLCTCCVALLPQRESRADGRTTLLLLGTTAVIGLLFGQQSAEALPKPREPDPKPEDKATHPSTPNPPPNASNTDTDVERTFGKLYKLTGGGWDTTAKYCVSLFGTLCYPCDLLDGGCKIRDEDQVIDMKTAEVH